MIGEGERAPDFTLRDQFGRDISLGGFRDRQHVLLLFYPDLFQAAPVEIHERHPGAVGRQRGRPAVPDPLRRTCYDVGLVPEGSVSKHPLHVASSPVT